MNYNEMISFIFLIKEDTYAFGNVSHFVLALDELLMSHPFAQFVLLR